MKSRISLILVLLVPVLLVPIASSKEEAPTSLHCNRPYTELKKNPGKPYNAVGFLNNGCTAFLIDANHIVAAAHCFMDGAGQPQPGLRFYPNFHPDRVVADKKHVPRGDVTRVVVASRAGGPGLPGGAIDWGIARIDNWQDTAGLDMTPLALAPAMPVPGTPVVNPAYTRHHFPYNDLDSIAWDNMQWDTANCGWLEPNKGMWAIVMRPAPLFDGVKADKVGCNSRWGSGMIHANCSLTTADNDVVAHNCDTIGGSSGSPILYKDDSGQWMAIGVHSGGVAQHFGELEPKCLANQDDTTSGPGVARFRNAPRFAANVAVYKSPFNASATAVFAADSDTGQVVYRFRTGASPTYKSPFTFWMSLGTPPTSNGSPTKIAACSANTPDKPQVFVVSGRSEIFTRSALPNLRWTEWKDFGLPSSVTSVADIDAGTDSVGNCTLFMVAQNGDAFIRPKTKGIWRAWSKVASGSYKSVTALNYGGVVWVALLDTDGAIWRTSRGKVGWTLPIKLTPPQGITSWRDIDMTLDELGRGFMLAIPGSGGNKLWFTPMYGPKPWSEWHNFDTHLWAPNAGPQNAPNLHSITASTWAEDPAGTTTPVVFGTDDTGTVYHIDYARVGTPGWILNWKSFYHETIPYP